MQAEYLLYYFNIPDLSPMALLEIFLLTLLRIAPIIGLAPFLGGKITPVSTRIGTALIFTFIFLPFVLMHCPHAQIGINVRFIFLATKELFLGTLMGYVISIPFLIAQNSGIVIDYMRGASSMQAQDPTLQSQSSSIGNLLNYLMIVLFFQIEGPFIFFDAFIKSLEIFPPNTFFKATFFSTDGNVWKSLLPILHQVMAISLQLAAPTLLACLMAEVFLGIANRLAPQVRGFICSLVWMVYHLETNSY
jgi:type III secretion protein T